LLGGSGGRASLRGVCGASRFAALRPSATAALGPAEQPRQDLLGRSGQRDAATIQRDQILARGQQNRAVRDDNHRTLLADLGQRPAQFIFGLAVEAARRLVEEDDRRVANQRTGDGNALALATREPPTGFADLGAVAVGKIDDVGMDAGGGRRLDDLLVGGVRDAMRDVVADRAGEQHTFLRHVSHPTG